MITRKLITAEELLERPADGNSYELVKGELRMMTPAGFEHGRVAARINFLIVQHVTPRNLGVVLAAETGFTLARNPDTVRAADVAFVRRESIPPADQQWKFAELAPDLVVEVVSPSDTTSSIEEKVRVYLDAGVRLVWVVDPGAKSVAEYRPSSEVKHLASDDQLQGYDVLPEFRCRVADFFA